MDWITGIQRAMDYVEAHITEPIDYEEVAKQAYSSSFHFQRVFSILCGFMLGDYIRARRLSLAGNELASSDAKVLDAALRYGYDSPESFVRAFTRLHGITPSRAKTDGAALKSYSRLSVKLILDGGTIMDYRIEQKDAFQLVSKKKHVSCKEEMTAQQIGQFWQVCGADGTIPALGAYMQTGSLFGNCIVGACFGKDAADENFPYAIGAAYNGKLLAHTGFTVEESPAHTYAVFPCVGKMPEAFQKLYHHIYSEFPRKVIMYPAAEWILRHTLLRM